MTLCGIGGGWTALGFYRGIQSQDYEYKQDLKKYQLQIEKDKADRIKYPEYYKSIFYDPPRAVTPKYLLTGMVYGLYGSFLYVIPVTCVLYMIKELYRIEIYARGLEGEKTKKYYNTLDPYSYDRD